jgi:hypothetical protein
MGMTLLIGLPLGEVRRVPVVVLAAVVKAQVQ